MQTSPDSALANELLDRSELVLELDGPQIEAWVSGLFPLFGDALSASDFVAHCQRAATPVAALVCRAVAELASGPLQIQAQEASGALAAHMPDTGAEVGTSRLVNSWAVSAPFGRSIVMGFEADVALPDDGEIDDELAEQNGRHCVLVELDEHGQIHDLQLAGDPQRLVEEVVQANDRMSVQELDVAAAVQQVANAWQASAQTTDFGPGIAANQYFVRRRLANAGAGELGDIVLVEEEIDIRRGLDDAGFADANRSARSTLQAAIGDVSAPVELSSVHKTWVAVVHGDAGELSAREREALLWLEWADWLGAGIGMLRAGDAGEVTGAVLVDHVNRCPEVSSTIDKADRDYAEWAFGVALDVLADAGAVQGTRLTPEGFAALGPALAIAWS